MNKFISFFLFILKFLKDLLKKSINDLYTISHACLRDKFQFPRFDIPLNRATISNIQLRVLVKHHNHNEWCYSYKTSVNPSETETAKRMKQ